MEALALPEEAKHDEAQSAETGGTPDQLAEYETVENSRPGLAVVIGVVLFAAGLGAGLWWMIRGKAGAAKPPQMAAVAPQQAPLTPAQPSDSTLSAKPSTLEDADLPMPATAEKRAFCRKSRVFGIGRRGTPARL